MLTDNRKTLICIPPDGKYIEILGHRIYGYDSFEAFIERLKRYADMEDEINRQKAEIERLETKYNKMYFDYKQAIENVAREHSTVLKKVERSYQERLAKELKAKAEAKYAAVQRFAERLRCEFWYSAALIEGINNLVKEFLEEGWK